MSVNKYQTIALHNCNASDKLMVANVTPIYRT